MSIERAKNYLKQFNEDKNIIEYTVSSATTNEASNAAGCTPAEIAKTLSFKVNGKVLLIVASGDMRVDNAKFKTEFGKRGSMLMFDEVEPLIGHAVGGVCPFGINENIDIYLDKSIYRFKYCHIAGGSSNSLIKLSIERLQEITPYKKWIDVCKPFIVEND